jgi:hypothetical protein
MTQEVLMIGNMEGKFIIMNLETMEYFKTVDGKLKYFDTIEDANDHCWIYELSNAWILELKLNCEYGI